MSLPTQDDLAALDYAFDGQPFVIISKAGDTTGLDLVHQGAPFVAIAVAAEAPEEGGYLHSSFFLAM